MTHWRVAAGDFVVLCGREIAVTAFPPRPSAKRGTRDGGSLRGDARALKYIVEVDHPIT